ncbi:exoribonuclease family protein, partial [Rhizodiscina lignyota]
DRRRINGPPGGTSAPIFASALSSDQTIEKLRPTRTRQADELRKIFLKTGLTPSASGSAYLELQVPNSPSQSLIPQRSTLKLSCTVHGPRPLPRSAQFSSNLVLTTTVKFAPFATRQRRGYVRDSTERDLAVHLETALKGILIGERWPKSGVDVVVTVLEGEEDGWWGDELSGGASGAGKGGGWGLMNVLAGCITVSCAAIVEAGIDCVDMVTGGVAAAVLDDTTAQKARRKGTAGDDDGNSGSVLAVLDPSPPEHREVIAACVVGYLSQRDEITELWMKGNAGADAEALVDRAVQAAVATRAVLVQAVIESGQAR